MWRHLLFAFETSVNYSDSLTVWLILQLSTEKIENFRPPAQGGQLTQLGKTKNTVCLKVSHSMFWSPGFDNLVLRELPIKKNAAKLWTSSKKV